MKKLQYGMVRWSRILTLLLLDIFMINFAVLTSLFLRYEFQVDELVVSGFIQTYFRDVALWYTLAALVIFAGFRLYRSLWEYASAEEMSFVIYAVILADAALLLIQMIRGVTLPRSLPVINLLLLMAGVCAVRYSYRLMRRVKNHPREKRQNTMLIGAGAAGALVLKELQHSSHSTNKIVCIIDDDVAKRGSYLMGVPVVGGREKIAACVEKYHIDDIILAIPTASPSDRRDLINLCQQTGCRTRILPGIYQLASGQVSTKKIRDVAVEDLLGRDRVQVDSTQIGEYITGKTVLVTGGGGSIGSELCRQIASLQPKKLVIFDIYENNAYEIQQELIRNHPELELHVLIGSVRDRNRVEQVFDKYRPELVCHAAAHKHVPLMEVSPNEAIKNNVLGTYNVACAADAYGAGKFVLISSDKAVNPTNVMGATKRICEIIIQTVGRNSKTTYSAVRFGNVLGSNGSVIPLFRRQIENGGPVTVTDKEIVRYFMTIPEAVSLVLQACAYAHGGEIFVLDMGEPVKIDDLARKMIRLSGFEPDVDIPIVYTGLRPGEKLFEELMLKDEELTKTRNDLIYMGYFKDFDPEMVMKALSELEEACRDDSTDIRPLIRKLVRTYRPNTAEV